MSKYTIAYSGFLHRLSEIDAIDRVAIQYTKRLGKKNDASTANALCRASIVLLSSHLEGYVDELAERILYCIFHKSMHKRKLAPRFLYYFSKDILDELSDTDDPDKIAEKMKKLIRRDADIWSDHPVFHSELPLKRFIRYFSNPNYDRIKKFIARFGYHEYDHDLKQTLKSNYHPCVNMINNVVHQRNMIAHGDIGILPTPKEVSDMQNLVKYFCRTTDIIVSDWFKKSGCIIR